MTKRDMKITLIHPKISKKTFGPEESSVYGALGCFESETPIKLFRSDAGNLTEEQMQEKLEKILNETSGRGHGSVLDQNCFMFDMENIPRAATLQLCLPEYLSHLQQSLRRVSADKGYFMPKSLRRNKRTIELMEKAFQIYEQMKDSGIPGEDARYLLPLGTRTNIQTLGNARELTHLYVMSQQESVPDVVKEVVNQMIEEASKIAPRLFKNRKTNYETLAWFPSSQLFSERNSSLDDYIDSPDFAPGINLINSSVPGYITEEGIKKAIEKRDEAELSNLKHIHFEFLVPMSLATFHQATRQRTWNQAVESIYHAAQRQEFYYPESVKKSNSLVLYGAIITGMVQNYHDLVAKGISKQDAILTIPHALEIYDAVHINGWNAIHSIGKRTCKTAQAEIRDIAKTFANIIKEEYPEIGNYCLPQGMIYGSCPERRKCGACKK